MKLRSMLQNDFPDGSLRSYFVRDFNGHFSRGSEMNSWLKNNRRATTRQLLHTFFHYECIADGLFA